jgi:hypothetical protein
VSNLGSSTGADIAGSIQVWLLFPRAGYRVTRWGRCPPPRRAYPVGRGSVRRSIVFRGRQRALQFLASADPLPGDNASAGGAGPLAANDPTVLVGFLGFSLPGHRRSLAVGARRSGVASGSSQRFHAEAHDSADSLAQTTLVDWDRRQRRCLSRPTTFAFCSTVCRSVATSDHGYAYPSFARYRWTKAIAMLPSPTADATRLTRLSRTSPHAKTPGTLVSSK